MLLDSVPLSALQHYLFCPRQCALIHVECDWEENYLTAKGRQEHERVDSGEKTTRPGVRTERSVHLYSDRYGLHGIADSVEYHGRKGRWERIVPVEYKHGAPKPHRADEVQLCAQGLCLEEMHSMTIPSGELFYLKTRRRLVVAFDDELRSLTLDVSRKARALMVEGTIPPPTPGKHCKACSLIDICLPNVTGKEGAIVSASAFNERMFQTELAEHPCP